MRTLSRLSTLGCAVALLGLSLAPHGAEAKERKLGGTLRAALASRPLRGHVDEVPVVVRLAGLADAQTLGRLAALGLVLDRDSDGAGSARARTLAGTASPAGLAALEASALVERVELDGHPFTPPRPLDTTSHMIGVDAVHRQVGQDGHLLTGAGITVCDVDSGIDVLHPMFFRADGGLFAFIDENDNGFLDPGVDSVEVDGKKATLRALNGVVSEYWSSTPLFGTEATELDLTYDYLYADLDGDGTRGVGLAAGFTEATPAYGEPLFVADDVDQNGELDASEKLARLSSSKIAAFRLENDIYERGKNLIEAPWQDEMQHGNGAGGVLVGGQLGYRSLVGMAPDADLIMATDRSGGREFAMTNFCVKRGAKVVLHEYAPWITYHLDGSSALEQLIDDTVTEGVVHVNPAGNLSTSDKMMRRTLDASGTTTIPLNVPNIGSTYMVATLLWLDTTRDLGFHVDSPSGAGIDIALGSQGFQAPFDGKTIFATRDDSTRGTAKVDIYVVDETSPVALAVGDWSLTVTDSSGLPPVELIGSVFDEVSGWGMGVHFTESTTEDHLVGWPGTADHGLAVAAFTGHDFDGTGISGQRAFYSGRGHRIDGSPLMWIAAPDNPIVPANFAERELSYMIYGGTSGASPHVAGSAALILEADPTLDGEGVKAKIKAGAISDDVTGSVPNDDFGWGKLDTHRAIFGVSAADGAAPQIVGGSVELAVGHHDLAIDASDADDDASSLTIEADLDYDGVYDAALDGATLALELQEPGAQLIKLRVTDPSGRTGQALLRLTVVPAEEEPPPPVDASFYPGGGALCSAGTAPGRFGTPGAAAGLTAALALSLARRRRR